MSEYSPPFTYPVSHVTCHLPFVMCQVAGRWCPVGSCRTQGQKSHSVVLYFILGQSVWCPHSMYSSQNIWPIVHDHMCIFVFLNILVKDDFVRGKHDDCKLEGYILYFCFLNFFYYYFVSLIKMTPDTLTSDM